MNILAVKNGSSLKPLPGAEYVFKIKDHIIVIGKHMDVFRLTAKT